MFAAVRIINCRCTSWREPITLLKVPVDQTGRATGDCPERCGHAVEESPSTYNAGTSPTAETWGPNISLSQIVSENQVCFNLNLRCVVHHISCYVAR